VFHMNMEEVDMFESIRLVGKRLFDFHVADNNRMACGMGALRWKKIFEALNDIKYKGSLTVEFVPAMDRTPANVYKNAEAAADASLTKEQLQFIEDHASGVLSEEFYSMLVERCAKHLRKFM
jgi:D-psicose/D-tagatose/L-ribulose 3-epimerase